MPPNCASFTSNGEMVISATVAGDEQVRVFDVGDGTAGPIISAGNSAEMHYREREHCLRIFRCHDGRVKRIVTEESPDSFLTVSEVGSYHCKRPLFSYNNLYVGRHRASTRFENSSQLRQRAMPSTARQTTH